MANIFQTIFGNYQEKIVKRYNKRVDEINRFYEIFLGTLKDPGDFRKKTEELREALREGKTTDDILCEAFALVKRSCRYLADTKAAAQVTGHDKEWDMVPFDVQLIGGMVIHDGQIAEMATGEGKTLVATMPAYLNALKGQVHVVTVNDYLALRDSQWMGLLYETLGLTVSCLQNGMDTNERKAAYTKDIVYGTNSEFGFDYLRDNMVWSLDEQVQKYREFAIIDEVDSILIDEARTPLIISGPVQRSNNSYFRDFNPKVRALVSKQRDKVSRLVREAQEALEKGEERLAGKLLLTAEKGLSKHKQLMKMKQETRIQRLIGDTELAYLRDKSLHLLEEDLYYVIDEKRHVADLTENGRRLLSPDNPALFELTDIGETFARIDETTDDEKEREKEKRRVQKEYAEKSEILHAVSQLLRAYSLFEKDVEYVVQDNKVLIVDEYTGRLMPGRRFSDGLHQALEAKEGVTIEGETQTFATITLQNFFRMYDKLAGMTGTAITEAAEFKEIYGMEVIVIPTNKPVRRFDYNDLVFKTKKEKFNAVIDEIERKHASSQPILVGTVSVEDSELLARMLTRKGIRANVLNAKNHLKEAEIISDAGKAGAVTIATNMAGRGTDIKLGEGVKECEECFLVGGDHEGEPPHPIKECMDDVPCGLYVIGTERHESRRIDRQLRGRSGRQGDPGLSRFFVSLEDNLMRLFGSDRIISVLDRLNMEEGQAIEHPLISRQIESAQKKVEHRNFQIRKHTLEYDDVMNKQRAVIYENRNFVLETAYIASFFKTLSKEEFRDEKELRVTIEELGFERLLTDLLKKYELLETGQDGRLRVHRRDLLKDEIFNIMERVVDEGLDLYCPPDIRSFDWDYEGLNDYLLEYFALRFPFDPDKDPSREELKSMVMDGVERLYDLREAEFGEETMRNIQRLVMLDTIDRNWREHLYAIDNLMEGINLRAYAQKDPLFEYKKESFEMFSQLDTTIEHHIIRAVFHVAVEKKENSPETEAARLEYSTTTNAAMGERGKTKTITKTAKVGRNDPCPCGSGKKYKHCCWPKYED
ncbi:preprotein translocase subunit SecA [Candidatus Mcinerneyibacteriota bacterium]|nr:preprotein translocase subunit SecA [Candidatus Mcinerneyibacteriota bacterium]